MLLDTYLAKWLKTNLEKEINPLLEKGIIFKVFPHLENLCIKTEGVFYKNKYGNWEETDSYEIFANEEDSPSDLFLNWILDIEKSSVTSLQVIMFNKMFGSINAKENVFKNGIPLYYFSHVLVNINYHSLTKLKYHEEIEGIKAIVPYYYYEPTPFDRSAGEIKDSIRPIKVMKIFTKRFFKKFIQDDKYRDRVLASHYIFNDTSSYKSSFENTGIFTTKPLKDLNAILKAVENEHL